MKSRFLTRTNQNDGVNDPDSIVLVRAGFYNQLKTDFDAINPSDGVLTIDQIDIDLEVVTATSINVIDVAITQAAGGMSAGTEVVKAYDASITGIATNANGSAAHGYYAQIAPISGDRADYSGYTVDVAGETDAADTQAGLTVGFTGILNNSGATWYGTRVSAATGDAATNYIDGTWYGGHIAHTVSSSADIYGLAILVDVAAYANSKVGLMISKDLTNATATGAGVENSSGALEIYSYNATSAAADDVLTVSGYLTTVQQLNSTALALADIYSGTLMGLSYSATTTGAGTATSSGTVLELDYNLNATFAGLDVTDFNVAVIDYDSTGAVHYTAGSYNLLAITGDDAGTPTYVAASILSGLHIDLDGMDITDADLTLYGLNLSMPSALAASTVAHIHADTSIVTDMPVPVVGADITNAGTVCGWIPYGKKGVDGLTVTEFYIDLVGLSSVATDGDVIGDTAETTSATLGQCTEAIQGSTIVAIEVVCLEAPVGGDPDIDLYSIASGTLSIDEAAGGGTQLIAAGESWTNGMTKGAIAVPTVDHYFYLTSGAAAAGDYSAGKFIIRIYGI